MPLPVGFLEKPIDRLRDDLAGLPDDVQAAAIRLRESGDADEVDRLLPGMIAWHLPSGAPPARERLEGGDRLREDLGLDSLALAELAFKLDEIFAVPIEMRETEGILTVDDLREFLLAKLGFETEGNDRTE